MALQATAETANAVGGSVVATGRVFSSGGIDGLILYSLLLGTFLIFLALCWALWMNHRQQTACNAQTKAFTDAGHAQADANKDLATAITAVASADMTFKQAVVAQNADLQRRIDELERQLRPTRNEQP